MTPAELLERAKIEAPGIAEDDFLSQLIVHLQSGRISASAYDCEIVQDNPHAQGAWRYMPRTAGDMQRRDIPTEEWVELAISLERSTATIWGHDRSPRWTRDDDDEPVWGDGFFDAAPVYTDLRLSCGTRSLAGLFVAPAKNGDADDEARDIIAAEIERAGDITLNGAAKIVRAALPNFSRDRARAIAKAMTGNEKRGPRGPRRNCAK